MDDHPIQTFEDAETFLATQADMVPALLRDLLDPESLRPVVARIMRHHDLPESMRTVLENEIALVLLAIEPYQNLHANIARSLALPPLTADAVAQDIMLALLSPGVLETLDVLYAVQEIDDRSSTTSSAVAADTLPAHHANYNEQETHKRIVGYANMHNEEQYALQKPDDTVVRENTLANGQHENAYVVPPYRRPMTDDIEQRRDDPYRNAPQ